MFMYFIMPVIVLFIGFNIDVVYDILSAANSYINKSLSNFRKEWENFEKGIY